MNESDDIGVIEEAGVAFDPTSQHLDLSKEEKRRTTALMMAIQAYQHLIIKEADYLREASNLARSGNGPALQPGTIDAMVIAAIKFDAFISGRIEEKQEPEATVHQSVPQAGSGSDE
jgi:hypothetical protein